jgi:hypothetical protein
MFAAPSRYWEASMKAEEIAGFYIPDRQERDRLCIAFAASGYLVRVCPEERPNRLLHRVEVWCVRKDPTPDTQNIAALKEIFKGERQKECL